MKKQSGRMSQVTVQRPSMQFLGERTTMKKQRTLPLPFDLWFQSTILSACQNSGMGWRTQTDIQQIDPVMARYSKEVIVKQGDLVLLPRGLSLEQTSVLLKHLVVFQRMEGPKITQASYTFLICLNKLRQNFIYLIESKLCQVNHINLRFIINYLHPPW